MTKKERRFAALAILIGLIVALIACELFLQALDAKRYHTPWFSLPNTAYDPELFWRPRPNFSGPSVQSGPIRINSQGFRSPEITPSMKNPIFCLGDSCTFGIGVDNVEKTYPRILESLFRQAGKNENVVNAGCPGYSTFQGLRLAKRIAEKYKPAAMTFYFGWNDTWLDNQPDYAKDTPAYHAYTRLRYSDSRIRLLRLLQSARYGLESLTEKTGDRSSAKTHRRVDADRFENNLRQAVILCDKRGVRPVLCTIPSALEIVPNPKSPLHKQSGMKDLAELARAIDDLNRRISSICNSTDADCVDLAAAFAKAPDPAELFGDPKNDPIHPGERGHRLIASELFQVLSALPDSQKNN